MTSMQREEKDELSASAATSALQHFLCTEIQTLLMMIVLLRDYNQYTATLYSISGMASTVAHKLPVDIYSENFKKWKPQKEKSREMSEKWWFYSSTWGNMHFLMDFS